VRCVHRTRQIHLINVFAPRISAVVDELMGWTTERVLVPGNGPSPTVGNHPWGVSIPVIVDMRAAIEELGYREPARYADALSDTLEWVLDACTKRDWREVFTYFGGYQHDPFDYDAEDAFLASMKS
jgi:hypothetical protein